MINSLVPGLTSGRSGRCGSVMVPRRGAPLFHWLAAAMFIAPGAMSGFAAAVVTSPPLSAQPSRRQSPESSALPQAVDLRPFFEKFGLERRRQGARPTCSVFTIVTAMEYALAKSSAPTHRLSVEYLNWAANQATRHAADGGFFSDLWRGFEHSGISDESSMPYRETFDPALAPSPEALAKAQVRTNLHLQLHWIKGWNVKTGLSESEFEAIKKQLAAGWPVCAGQRWPVHERWRHGVLQMCAPEAVRDGHSVLLVGYRDDPAEEGGGVFIFRNTSGEGRDGSMPYAYALQYVNDALWIEGKGTR